uniref:BipA n=3 Tax=Borrelia turicatae TaxID=142 RepID=D5JEH2_BORTU|nr:BipA [Borrelia turicatae]ADN26518.1 immunogenic protein A [Borrelia turicatae 91E135]
MWFVRRVDMKNFGIIVLFLSTLTLSCKFYDTGSTSYWSVDNDGFVQGTKSFVDSPLRKPDRFDQEVSAGGKKIEKAVSRNLRVAGGQRQGIADDGIGVAGVREAGGVLKDAGNAVQRDINGSGEGIKNDVIQNPEGVGVQVAVGSADTGADSGQEAGKVFQNLGDTGTQSIQRVVSSSDLNSDLGVGSKDGISTNGMSTNHVTENENSINSITSTSSGLNTALQMAGTSTRTSGYEGEITTNTQDRTFVETGTQDSKAQYSDFSDQDIRDKVLGSVVGGVVDNVMSGIDNVIQGAGTFATAAMQGVGTVIDVLQDVGTFVISDIQNMGARMLFGTGENSSVASEGSESVMSLSSNDSSEAKDVTVVLSSDVTSKGNDVAVGLSSDETQVIGRLEKYLQSAIKINGRSDSDQSNLESGRKKFFNWLKTSDTNASKRKELVQDLQKVFDLIKEKSSDSTELKHWVQSIVDRIEDKSTIVDIDSDDELNNDKEVDFLIENTLASRDYSGFAVSLLFQSLADTLYDSDNNRDKSEEQIFQDLRKVFSDSSDKSEGVLGFKSKIEATN